jgi:hypothetical protein
MFPKFPGYASIVTNEGYPKAFGRSIRTWGGQGRPFALD